MGSIYLYVKNGKIKNHPDFLFKLYLGIFTKKVTGKGCRPVMKISFGKELLETNT